MASPILKMKKRIACFIGCILLFVGMASAQPNGLKSPNGRIELKFEAGKNLNDPLSYQLSFRGNSVIDAGRILLNGNDQKLVLNKVERSQSNTQWQTTYGERRVVTDNYQQVKMSFRSQENDGLQLTVFLRLYNEGFAYRYAINQDKEIILKDESSLFSLPENAVAWVSSTAQGALTEKKLSDIKNTVERPLTIRLKNDLYLALGEAGLVDFARMKFSVNEQSALITRLDGETRGNKELKSPWRYVMIGTSPADLLQKNYLILNLNEPCQIKDTKWIKPGKVLREVTLTTDGSYRSIDFAAKHHLQYILFDAGWYGREDQDTSDATRVLLDPLRSKGPLDLQKVIAYGEEKGVGIILYVNRRALERQLDSLLPLYESWGVKGLKFGFVQVGSQKWTSWLHEAIRKCAKYHMIVDVHDEYRPTGYNRTYPNLLTQEGIRGDEESPVTEHSITTLFTRMIAGAADNTNCFFTARVDKMGSHTAQMAKSLCIYSPLQFLYWYDHPKSDTSKTFKEGDLREVPELAWYDALPTTWDETRVLEGDMQAFATVARRKGTAWFVGSLNGKTERQLKLALNFLSKGRSYSATVYSHHRHLQTATHVKMQTMNVNAATVLILPIESQDGIAIQIQPK